MALPNYAVNVLFAGGEALELPPTIGQALGVGIGGVLWLVDNGNGTFTLRATDPGSSVLTSDNGAPL